MKRFLTIFGLVVFVLTMILSGQAKAYEQDTHLRMTYLLARAMGINDEVAKYLAYADLNIDKSILTSAMLHPAQRGLFHFTGTYQPLVSSAHGGEGVVTHIREMLWSKKIAIAERNHSMGSLLIYLGMLEGDLQMIGAGLHVKQDTYGHAGFTNAWGHMFDGHNPDRAFLETEKYEDMIRSLTQSLGAVRDILPESMIDRAGALTYLNQFAKESSFKRDLTAKDLENPTTVSAVLLSSVELKRMYSENVFNNYNFKKLALKLIYDDFKERGIIHKDITFDNLFPENILRDSRMDTADTIKAVIVSDMESDFAKNKDGIDIIDNLKLFGVQNYSQMQRKSNLEKERYEVRLREFENNRKKYSKQGSLSDLDYQIMKDSLKKEYNELSIGMNLGNITEELQDALDKAPAALQRKIKMQEKAIREKYKDQIENAEQVVSKGLAKDLPLEDRIEALRQGGIVAENVMNEISEMKREALFEIFVKTRSRQLSEFKLATEVADRLTKDFIPRKYTQYVKQAFESETYTRIFEVTFKDEAWRRYINKNFGVNWVFAEASAASDGAFAKMAQEFKITVNRKGVYSAAMEKRTKRLLYSEAVKLASERIPGELGLRGEAQNLKYTNMSTLEWNIKMVKYVGPAVIPFTGERYLEKMYSLAEREGKAHETENVKQSYADGKYKQPSDPKILDQIARFSAPNKCILLFLK